MLAESTPTFAGIMMAAGLLFARVGSLLLSPSSQCFGSLHTTGLPAGNLAPIIRILDIISAFSDTPHALDCQHKTPSRYMHQAAVRASLRCPQPVCPSFFPPPLLLLAPRANAPGAFDKNDPQELAPGRASLQWGADVGSRCVVHPTLLLFVAGMVWVRGLCPPCARQKDARGEGPDETPRTQERPAHSWGGVRVRLATTYGCEGQAGAFTKPRDAEHGRGLCCRVKSAGCARAEPALHRARDAGLLRCVPGTHGAIGAHAQRAAQTTWRNPRASRSGHSAETPRRAARTRAGSTRACSARSRSSPSAALHLEHAAEEAVRGAEPQRAPLSTSTYPLPQ
ncbi:hypothetical protein FB451DRAFT_1401828 [Mycena latifolia]|nr:hypothetical protein FB451DRAFT_1401828 [Mycena latifolia]